MEKEKQLLNHLLEFITENKREQFFTNIKNRTRHLTVALEDIYQPQNASAVLRTCDCLGIQDIHIIENRNEYTLNPDVALGASKWLNMIKYNGQKNNTLSCLHALKEKGYRVVATTPHTNDVELNELDVSQKTALVFGTEMHGVSDDVMKEADAFVRIPMYGFTESYNISVSAAIVLYTLIQKTKATAPDWQLSKQEQTEILTQWAKQVVKKADSIESRFTEQGSQLDEK